MSNPMLMCDFYKLSHREMYPPGTEYVYSTWTPRTSRIPGINEVVVFGLQKFISKYLVSFFKDNFFSKDVDAVCADYQKVIKNTLGQENAPVQHIRELHALGHLPLEIKALPEGTVVPLRTPWMTIRNTNPKFFWITNFIESLMSCELWQASTSATIARRYRKLFDREAEATGGSLEFVPFQGHDFSFRGMSSLDSAVNSGLGHLLSFVGSDTIPAIEAAYKYYVADGLVGTSIPATEHSVQCAYGDDYEYFRRVITEVHPTGLVSIVSDGYDFWGVMTETLPKLKEAIMARNGKVVIRPDSGDPVKIVVGDPEATTECERKGAIEVLWDLFGGKVNAKGFKELDPHIGLIYGDAITYERARDILAGLRHKGFASTNVVFGIGSYTYQYNTRDTFGYALKSTACVINGQEKAIFKIPKTDDGTKNSQRGAVAVYDDGWKDGYSMFLAQMGDRLRIVFLDGIKLNFEAFEDIRNRLQ